MTLESLNEFAETLSEQVATNAPVAEECKSLLILSMTWTASHMADERAKHCEILLQGAYGTAMEAISLLSLGLVRPSILSLRAHYELSLQFLFYKDHPVEWRSVTEFRNQPSLPGVIKKYLKDFHPDFESRFKVLAKYKSRQNEDCYTVLSGIAHGTAIHSITSATTPSELVEDFETVSASIQVFKDVSEHLSDINISCFNGNWLSLPATIRDDLSQRFQNKSASELLDN